MLISKLVGKFVFWLRYFSMFVDRNSPQSNAIKRCMTLIANETNDNDKIDQAKVEAFRQIYCQGPILHAVQEANLFVDSKYFVDMTLKKPSVETLRAFFALGKNAFDKETLKEFVEEHFGPPGSELETCHPKDWKRYSKTIEKIKDKTFHEWAKKIHLMWPVLCRRVKDDVYYNPESYSLLYVPHPFIIPGGRFREWYYWDSYWIIKGLLVSEMYMSAKNMIKNFGVMVKQYGFVPNGGRAYYLLRSQPPMLTPMTYDYYLATDDTKFVTEMLPILEEEYNFWASKRSFSYRESANLFRYKVQMNMPRPESYREDMELVKNLNTTADKELLWSNIASAAETGWDFSSRWFAQEGLSAHMMKSIRTVSIVPVDLNAFMCMNTRILAKLYEIKGNRLQSFLYEARFMQAKAVMKRIHWNRKDGIWYDYDFEHKRHIKQYYLSNVLPLFAQCYEEEDVDTPEKVFNYMKRIGAFNLTKGIPTSFIKSQQQWDSVNAWPPLIHMTIDGFRTSNVPELNRFAKSLAEQWLRSLYGAYEKTASMFEKYNVDENSTEYAGKGGEYEVQTGFGWTNGVVLDLLAKFGETISSSTIRIFAADQFSWCFLLLIWFLN